VAGCPLIHNFPVLKLQTQPFASSQSIPSITSSTSSDTNAVVHKHFSFSSNGSRTSPSIRIGVLLAAQTWRIEGLTSILMSQLIRSFGIRVSSQPVSTRHGTSFHNNDIFKYTLAWSCIFVDPRTAKLFPAARPYTGRFLVGQSLMICPGKLQFQHVGVRCCCGKLLDISGRTGPLFRVFWI